MPEEMIKRIPSKDRKEPDLGDIFDSNDFHGRKRDGKEDKKTKE